MFSSADKFKLLPELFVKVPGCVQPEKAIIEIKILKIKTLLPIIKNKILIAVLNS
jgi:hypothetical protein